MAQMPPVEDGTDEVVNGELRFMPPTHYPHAEIVQRLIVALIGRLEKNRVAILGSNFGLMMTREPLTCRSLACLSRGVERRNTSIEGFEAGTRSDCR